MTLTNTFRVLVGSSLLWASCELDPDADADDAGLGPVPMTPPVQTDAATTADAQSALPSPSPDGGPAVADGAVSAPADAGTHAAPDAGVADPGTCAALPPTNDYAAKGPFADAKMVSNVGPNNNYTLFRPDSSLGKDGFKHPIAAWGNGIATTPDQYEQTLTLVASHGFVVVACNDTQAERPCLSDGLDWLIAQNDAGEMQGKLDITREVTIGYSWGGGAAIDTANRPNVKATISLHGMPPRGSTAFEDMHSPLLLYTSTGDSFVSAEGYVTPNYEASKVQTFYATLADQSAGHLYPVDEGAISCAVSLLLGTCKGAIEERASLVAWLRLWACGDQQAREFFYGDDCTLCRAPWAMPQRKAWL